MLKAMEETLNFIMDTKSLPDLQPVIDKIGCRMGFSCSAYFSYPAYNNTQSLSRTGHFLPFYIVTAPEVFQKNYIRGNFVTYDPVVRRASTTNAAFLWTDCNSLNFNARPRPGVKSKARQLMELASDFHFHQGYVVPCHAVDKQGRPSSAFVSFFWEGNQEELKKPGAIPFWLRLAVSVYHEKMLDLRGVATSGGDAALPILSDRELECLAWTSRGKTNNEIAGILTITERTVEFHLRNAMQKLGVYNKPHAVAVAIYHGLITP